jgi:hypothetical protein
MPVSVTSETTAAIPWNATAAQVQSALEALTSITPGDVSVALSGSAWQITFQGTLADQDVAPLVAMPQSALDAMTTTEVLKGGSGSNEIQRVSWVIQNFSVSFTLTYNALSADVPEEHMGLRWVADTLTSDAILQALVGTAIHPDSVPGTHPALAIVYSYQIMGQDDKGQGDVERAGTALQMTVRATYKGSTYPKALEATAQRIQELLDLQRITVTYDSTTAYITCDRGSVTTAQEETATDTYMHNIQVFDLFVSIQ